MRGPVNEMIQKARALPATGIESKIKICWDQSIKVVILELEKVLGPFGKIKRIPSHWNFQGK